MVEKRALNSRRLQTNGVHAGLVVLPWRRLLVGLSFADRTSFEILGSKNWSPADFMNSLQRAVA